MTHSPSLSDVGGTQLHAQGLLAASACKGRAVVALRVTGSVQHDEFRLFLAMCRRSGPLTRTGRMTSRLGPEGLLQPRSPLTPSWMAMGAPAYGRLSVWRSLERVRSQRS